MCKKYTTPVESSSVFCCGCINKFLLVCAMPYYLFLPWQSQLRHINHAFINIATSILGGRRWHGIWRIRWSPTRYWRSLQIMRCIMWRSGWLLTNRGQLRWIDNWIIQWRRHRYHLWWQIIDLLVTVLAIKALFIVGIYCQLIPDWIKSTRAQIFPRPIQNGNTEPNSKYSLKKYFQIV